MGKFKVVAYCNLYAIIFGKGQGSVLKLVGDLYELNQKKHTIGQIFKILGNHSVLKR